MIAPVKWAGLVLCVLLSACTVSVELPAGEMVTPAAQWQGTWQAIMQDEPKAEIFGVQVAGEELIISPSPADAGKEDEHMTARVYRFKDVEYLAIHEPDQQPGYYVLRVDERRDGLIRLRTMDKEHVRQLLTKMKLPIVVRKMGATEELFISKAAFHKLMTSDPDGVFAKGKTITLK